MSVRVNVIKGHKTVIIEDPESDYVEVTFYCSRKHAETFRDFVVNHTMAGSSHGLRMVFAEISDALADAGIGRSLFPPCEEGFQFQCRQKRHCVFSLR